MITVALLDDEALVANSLATLIGLEHDIDVAHVSYAAEALLQWWRAQEAHPDVLISDLQLGAGMDGIDVAAALGEDARVVIVTSHARPAVLKRALAAGVLGVLPKTSSARDFAAAIRAAHEGRRHVDPELAATAIATGDSPLTDREGEVLALAGRGHSNEAIAARLHLAPGTVRNYVSAAIEKTGAANRVEAYSVAFERGWL